MLGLISGYACDILFIFKKNKKIRKKIKKNQTLGILIKVMHKDHLEKPY
jgi:hypothetical protein